MTFFRDNAARGLIGVKLVSSDAHAGLVAAACPTIPGASWQCAPSAATYWYLSAAPELMGAVAQRLAAYEKRY